ncbi:MAG: nucleotide sugar dehydrogenase, partial [Chloroflexi bacterium]|nr:nucleotide sugar dehydrogenase [Chloroflexota bacterium]
KENVQDTRNSPALRVAELLMERGAEITYSDQHVPEICLSGRQFHSLGLDQAARQEFDAAVILVNHSYFDWAEVVKNNQLVIDAVNATRSLGPRPNVVKL